MNARCRVASRVTRLARAEAPVVRRAAPTPVAVVARPVGPEIPADVAEQFAAGRLSQRCPEPGCETVEAAGFYSTCHERKTGPADWYRGEASPAEKAAMEASRAKRHTTPDRGSALTKSPTFGVLAGPAESLTLGF